MNTIVANDRPLGSKSHHIMMVDDDPDDIFAVKRGFLKSRLNVQFSAVLDGESFFDFLFKEPNARPDLILLDINMPKMNGFEVLERLRANENWDDIPVTILSTSASNEDRDKGLKLGATDFVSKFSTYAELEDWVKKIEADLESAA